MVQESAANMCGDLGDGKSVVGQGVKVAYGQWLRALRGPWLPIRPARLQRADVGQEAPAGPWAEHNVQQEITRRGRLSPWLLRPA